MAGTVISPDEFGITGNETIEQQVKILRDRVFMLLEQLKYLLANLGEDNFNETELKKITEPIYAQISDVEGKLAELVLNAEGLSLSISDLEQGISLLRLTSQGLELSVSSITQGMTSLSLSVSGLSSSVSDLEGKVSTVKQTVDGLQITTVGGTSYISGDHIKTGTIEGVEIESRNPNNTKKVELSDGQVGIGDQGINYGTLTYDQENGRVLLETTFMPLKIRSTNNMAIDGGYNGTIYIGTSDMYQRIMLGDSMNRSSTVELWGNIYINGESLASYISRIANS